MTKRTKDKIRGAQCPDCGKMMEKVKRPLMGTIPPGKVEIIWKCTDPKCSERKA